MGYEIGLTVTIDCAHRVVGHKGKCARLHGHTYQYDVRVKSSILVEPGFVIDYADIKSVLAAWDHKTLLWEQDPIILGRRPSVVEGEAIYWSDRVQDDLGVVRLPFNPTAENLARHVAEEIRSRLPLGARVEVICRETPKSYARWVAH